MISSPESGVRPVAAVAAGCRLDMRHSDWLPTMIGAVIVLRLFSLLKIARPRVGKLLSEHRDRSTCAVIAGKILSL